MKPKSRRSSGNARRELADLLEVMQAAVKARDWTLEELEQVRVEKAAKRGGSEEKILLKEVREDR